MNNPVHHPLSNLIFEFKFVVLRILFSSYEFFSCKNLSRWRVDIELLLCCLGICFYNTSDFSTSGRNLSNSLPFAGNRGQHILPGCRTTDRQSYITIHVVIYRVGSFVNGNSSSVLYTLKIFFTIPLTYILFSDFKALSGRNVIATLFHDLCQPINPSY